MGSSASAIRAGRAFVEFFTDDRKLVRGLKSAQKRLKAFSASVGRIGLGFAGMATAALAPIGAMVNSFVDAGDAIDKISGRTGVGAESVSAFGFAAEQSGQSVEVFEKGIKGMQKTIGDAKMGLTGANDALGMLGVTIDQLDGKTPEEQFLVLSEAISKIDDPTQRAAAAMKVMGRAGQQLLPMFAGGREGIEAMMAEAKELGFVLSEDQAKAAAASADAMNRLKRSMGGAMLQIGAIFADLLTQAADNAAYFTSMITRIIQNNTGLIKTIAMVVAGVGAVGGGFLAVSAIASILAAGMGGIVTVIGLIGSALAFILSPIGLIVAAFGTALYASEDLRNGLYALFEDAMEYFGGIYEIVQQTMGGIVDAFTAGNLELAGTIALKGLYLAFRQGVKPILEFWYEFTGGLYDSFYSVIAEIQKIYERVVGFIARQLVKLYGLFDSSFDVEATLKEMRTDEASRISSINQNRDRLQDENAQATNDSLRGLSEELASLKKDLAGSIKQAAVEAEQYRQEKAEQEIRNPESPVGQAVQQATVAATNSAIEVNSSEGINAVLRALTGDDRQLEQKLLKKQVNHLKEIANNTETMKGVVLS